MENYFDIMNMEQNAVYNLDVIKNKKVKELTIELIKNINGFYDNGDLNSRLKGYNFFIERTECNTGKTKSYFYNMYIFKNGKLILSKNLPHKVYSDNELYKEFGWLDVYKRDLNRNIIYKDSDEQTDNLRHVDGDTHYIRFSDIKKYMYHSFLGNNKTDIIQ